MKIQFIRKNQKTILEFEINDLDELDRLARNLNYQDSGVQKVAKNILKTINKKLTI